MRIVHLTPGTGGFYCGSCLRDNALVTELRLLGADVQLIPLYLPHFVDEPAAAEGAPIFFGGVNVYLQQASALFRKTPRFIDALFDSRAVLKLASRKAGMSRPEELGEMTLSMLEGENGRQVKELSRLVSWLAAGERPDVVCLSNALLLGMARRIKEALGVPVVATLQGEDTFLDALPEPFRAESWRVLAERAAEVDGLVAVSRYHASLMAHRLGLDEGRIDVVHNGIHVEGYGETDSRKAPPSPPVLGFLARMCKDKGLPTLVEAFVQIRKTGAHPDLRLHVAGAMTAADEPLVRTLKRRLADEGLAEAATFSPNLSFDEKRAFLGGLSVFSVPATYGESFGLYLLEALAAGVPVVAPRHGAFPEVLGETGGGVLCAPDDPAALADAISGLLADEPRRLALRSQGQAEVKRRFQASEMAKRYLAVLARAAAGAGAVARAETSTSTTTTAASPRPPTDREGPPWQERKPSTTPG